MKKSKDKETLEGEAWVAVIKTNEVGYFVMLSERDHTVHGFKTAQEALLFFEESYNRAHARGGTWVASACINWMFFQPSIVRIDGVHTIIEWLKDGDAKNARVCTYSHTAGSFAGVPLDTERAAKVWENGSKPRLISR